MSAWFISQNCLVSDLNHSTSFLLYYYYYYYNIIIIIVIKC